MSGAWRVPIFLIIVFICLNAGKLDTVEFVSFLQFSLIYVSTYLSAHRSFPSEKYTHTHKHTQAHTHTHTHTHKRLLASLSMQNFLNEKCFASSHNTRNILKN